jgi:hypothetical protein
VKVYIELLRRFCLLMLLSDYNFSRKERRDPDGLLLALFGQVCAVRFDLLGLVVIIS